MFILLICKDTGGYICQADTWEFPFPATCLEKE